MPNSGLDGRRNIVFIGSHLGFPMERTPLGGGAMVGLQLVRHWPSSGAFRLAVVGSGPLSPAPAADYVQLPAPRGSAAPDLVGFTELQYAAFCRKFEEATTRWLLGNRARFPPERTCVVVNDISEAPDLQALSAAGYPIVSLWHVDVVDYFSKLYLRRAFRPESLTRLYERARRLGAGGALPDVLRLVFEKQRRTVAYSSRMIMPSRAMIETVRRCYGGGAAEEEAIARRCSVVPWGVWDDGVPPESVAGLASELRTRYRIGPAATVLMTLSRISPEKGLKPLLDGLRFLEKDGFLRGRDVCLFLCGEPAFMRGRSYLAQVRAAAARLRGVRVFWPGYLSAAGKRAHFSLANLFVSPSLHESYGLTIVEAMRAGLPVLASDHAGARDLVDDSVGARVRYPSQARAAESLALGLRRLLGDPARLRRLGESARAAAEVMPFSDAARIVLETALELADRTPAGAAAR